MINKQRLFIVFGTLAIVFGRAQGLGGCSQFTNFIETLNIELNKPAMLSQLVSQLNVNSQWLSYGFEVIIDEYYRNNHTSFMHPLAYSACYESFNSLINNALVRANLSLSGQIRPLETCSSGSIQFTWTDNDATGTTLSWSLRKKSYSIEFKPVTDYIMIAINNSLQAPAGTYADFFSSYCPDGQDKIFEFIKSQLAVSECDLDDILFESTATILNNPTYLASLASELKLKSYKSSDNLATIISEYIGQSDSNKALEDLTANCLPQLNRLVGDYFASLNINVTNSVFLRNASSEANAYVCQTQENTFVFDDSTSTWSWQSGAHELNMQPVLSYIQMVLEYSTANVSLSGLIDERLYVCSEFNHGFTVLTDEVFLYLRSLLMGQDAF